MANLKELFGTDKVKEKEGVWQDMGDGLKMRIARIGNPKYQKRFEALSKPHRRALRRGTLSNEIAEKLLVQCIAETIVLDWEGVEEDGAETPFSVENAVRILLEYPELRKYVEDIANEMEGYKAEDDEEAIDNLKK
jgi:hypothetical protein